MQHFSVTFIEAGEEREMPVTAEDLGAAFADARAVLAGREAVILQVTDERLYEEALSFPAVF